MLFELRINDRVVICSNFIEDIIDFLRSIRVYKEDPNVSINR
jgi:hypothetical protein